MVVGQSRPKASYLQGHGDLVTGSIMGIAGGTIWFIGVVTILTTSP